MLDVFEEPQGVQNGWSRVALGRVGGDKAKK